MQAGYSWVRRTVSICPKRILVSLGLIALPMSICSESFADGLSSPFNQFQVNLPLSTPPSTTDSTKPDPRVTRLERFFASLHCPVRAYASDFIKAADANNLDWRLLPSISVVESGGGKAYRNNNIFGWNGGSHVFESIRASIQEVAEKLAAAPLYRRHKDALGKLHVYNRSEQYATNVLALMQRISPAPSLSSFQAN